MVAMLLTPVASHAASAQQICLPATETARLAIDVFLLDSALAPWRAAHGITASNVGGLRPLSDATDAALCRRMDSTMAVRPAYYYSAGSVVLGSNFAVPDTGAFLIEEGKQIVFLFDSLGNVLPHPDAANGIGAVTRTSTGSLFRDDFNRANTQLVGAGKSWTRMGGPSVDADWQVQGNQAKVLSAGASARQAEAYPQGVTPQTGDVVVQSWFQRGNTAGRTGVTLVQAGEAGGILFIRDPYHGWELWNYGSGFYTNPANNAASVRESGVLKLRRKSGRYQAWIDGILIFDIASDARLNTVALYPALIQLQQPATWDDFSAYAGNTVTITGLPASYKLRVGGALSAAAVSAQPTTVDVGGVSFPVAQIEILDASGTLVKVYAPTDGVWGGDVYSLSGTP
jgi:hypothetical protein